MTLLEHLEGDKPVEKKPTTHRPKKLSGLRGRNELEAKLQEYLVGELKKYPNLTDGAIREWVRELGEPFIEAEEEYLAFETLSENMALFLDACVKANMNILISGGTGSGKSSTLNVISSFIPDPHRIITIEDAVELKLSQEHIISLETRSPNIEGKGTITITDLVKNSLRMRPNRIVIGEVRGAEALDMQQAMNRGYDGLLGKGHANSPRELLSRFETMVLMAGVELPVRAIREQIESALDIIVHQSRLKDGTRKITHITEGLGMEGDTIVLQDLYIYQPAGMDEKGNLKGGFVPTGIRLHRSEQFEAYGIELRNEWFQGGGYNEYEQYRNLINLSSIIYRLIYPGAQSFLVQTA